MTMKEMSKTYNPKDIEDQIYSYWMAQHCFAAPNPPKADTYCIVIPPPNVTGALHMGHALNNTIQDILTRWKRMSGYATLWQPGTDHAGIATQNVGERELLETDGKKRQDIGRNALIDRIWQWRETYGDRILNQLQCIGSSCDWSRTRFTLDDGLSKAVRECFVSLYDQNLIYRGKYIVNWCPRCLTALADDEVDHVDEQSHLWHINYPLSDGSGYITVATTRPETLLGDTAVAVNPTDTRYTHLIGKTIDLPETNRKIPIVADDFVDMSFGTGAVKVTPAHDPNDFAIGERHHLEKLCIMNENATMNANAGSDYEGLDRLSCRKKLVEKLESQSLLIKVDEHSHSVGHCYRCKTTIEPYLSDQWFVKMKPLAEKAIQATTDNKVTFHPNRWNNFYLQWLENVRDWCISRQIWWGHRIPVWYCQNKDTHCPPIVMRDDPTSCPHCNHAIITQDEDVLDTWFSSALWPFSTLGWPEHTDMLSHYYPTNTLVTDRGIIYFWVARMVMMGLNLMNDVPFTDVYINGTILDDQGRKMSKSLGNGIDPIDIIERYGADAMRFSLMLLSTDGQDLKLSESKFEMGRNFCNKLWNASRFAMHNLDNYTHQQPNLSTLSIADHWVLDRFNQVVEDVTSAFTQYRFSVAAQSLYHFIWNEFCDWYLEASKPHFRDDSNPSSRLAAQYTLYTVLDGILKLAHPVMPFITEAIWQSLHNNTDHSIMKESFPVKQDLCDIEKATQFMNAKDIISAIRNIRGENNVKPSQKINAILKTTTHNESELIAGARSYIENLAKLSTLNIDSHPDIPKHVASAQIGTCEVHIPYEGLIDIHAEKARLEKEIQKTTKDIEIISRKLSNESFVNKAPAAIVEREKEKCEKEKIILTTLQKSLEKLNS